MLKVEDYMKIYKKRWFPDGISLEKRNRIINTRRFFRWTVAFSDLILRKPNEPGFQGNEKGRIEYQRMCKKDQQKLLTRKQFLKKRK